jgi:hypothetical protein
MPTPTYTPLATVTLGTTASSVTFSNIPATYRDLIVIFNGTGTASSNLIYRINGDTGGNYNRVQMQGNGSTTASAVGSNETESYAVGIGSVRTMARIELLDYSATNKHKTSLARGDDTSGLVIARANRWANTAAITSIACIAAGTTFATGSTLSLYGVIA